MIRATIALNVQARRRRSDAAASLHLPSCMSARP